MAKQDTPAPASFLPGTAPISLDQALRKDIWDQWVAQVKANPAYKLPDPDDPDQVTDASWTPPPTLIVQYGEGPNDYIATDFTVGQVMVRDGNDPTGRAWKYPMSDWRRFVASVRGEELPPDERGPEGPTQYEEAAQFAKRTAAHVQADRDAREQAGNDEQEITKR